MPDGKNHNTINIIILMLILSVTYALFSRPDISIHIQLPGIELILIFSLTYLFGTFFLSPDLDIESSPYNRWGVFKFLWWPYKVIFKHRGLSHNPVFGPLTIMINFALIFVPVLVVLGFNLALVPLDIAAAAAAGFVLSIEMHILADMVVSDLT
ncbi:MAG: metal-binding protein [Methanosarcinales archaeon]|nr:metal-binding protein [Methanosarcinales archaeon]